MKNAANFFIVTISTVLILIYAEGLIIPFIFAFLLWFLTVEFRKQLNKITFIEQKLPKWFKNVFVFILMISSLYIIVENLYNSIHSLSASYSQYGANIESTISKIDDTFQINLKKKFDSAIVDIDFTSILSSILNELSTVLGDAFMIIIYALFLLLEESTFSVKLKKLYPQKNNYEKVNSILGKIETSVFRYLRLKTVVSLLTGFLSFLVLYFIGIDSPVFWAFLIFLLNYIPTIGSLVATVFPAAYSLIQFGNFSTLFIILAAVGAVQLLVGNYIEPRIMGKSLNISPLITIIALSVWGQIWGITGMVLSVPITVIMIIIFSQFEQTKAVAIMMTENGDIE